MKIETIKQIQLITSKLIKVGLSEEQNFPSDNSGLVYISGRFDTSIALRNLPYSDIYNVLNADKNFNIKMIDGALIQMMYLFEGEEIIKHRLSFFPSPNLLEFQNNRDIYEQDVLYADVINRNIVSSPMRFDFDPTNHEIRHHPKSHLTIGQYKNCRLPISKPISPFNFISFILDCFYNTASREYSNDLSFKCKINFNRCIHSEEESILHLNII